MANPRQASAVIGRRRAVLYLRQSTYREESISLELQEDAGRTYAQQQGYEVIAVKADPGISGRTFDRPAVKEVMAMIEAREADVVVVWKWSRLARSVKDFALAVDRVESIGGTVESATEQIDTTTAAGKFTRDLFAQFAAFESARIGEGWKEAKERRIRQGLTAGGPTPFGYRQVNKHLEIDPIAGPLLAEAYRRYVAGQSFDTIADYFTSVGVPQKRTSTGVWSAKVISYMLDSGIGAGKLRYLGETLKGAHNPVISEDEWTAYRAARARRRKSQDRRGPHAEKTLTGLLYCECGGKLYSASDHSNPSSADYVRCNSARREPHHQTRWRESEILPHVFEWLSAYEAELNQAASVQSANISKPRALESEGTVLRHELSTVQRKIDRLTALLVDETLTRDDYQRAFEPLGARREFLNSQILESDATSFMPPIAVLPTLSTIWPQASHAERRELLRHLIKRIVLPRERPFRIVCIEPK